MIVLALPTKIPLFPMFNKNNALEQIAQLDKNTIANHLGIEYMEVGDDYIIARMPVDHRTHQPFGLLHGGASVVLAETIGSLASCGLPNCIRGFPITGR